MSKQERVSRTASIEGRVHVEKFVGLVDSQLVHQWKVDEQAMLTLFPIT